MVAEAGVKAAGELAVLQAAVGRLQLSREGVLDGMARAVMAVCLNRRLADMYQL